MPTKLVFPMLFVTLDEPVEPMLEVITATDEDSSTTTETLDFTYDASGSPYTLTRTAGTTSSTYYYVVNLQGDVMRLVAANGATVAEYWYDPWGRVLSASGAMAEVNPLRYRGYYYDAETEFYYLQSRYFDPVICRFVNSDGLASTGDDFLGYNMFAYCMNNPLLWTDWSGAEVVFGSGTSEEEMQILLGLLQSLTDDEIAIEPYEENGKTKYKLVIVSGCNGDKPLGTQLIRDLVNSESTITLRYYQYGPSTGYHNGGYVYYNAGSLDWYKKNICPYDGVTAAIILAHELIHAHRANCEGLNLDDYQEYNGIYGCSLEEIYTCGFDMLQYPSQYSENLLRLEQGLPLRTMYEREAYFSALRRNAYAQDYMV